MEQSNTPEPDRRVLMRRAWLLCVGTITLFAVPAALAAWHWPSVQRPLLFSAIWCTLLGLSWPVLVGYVMRRPHLFTDSTSTTAPDPWAKAVPPTDVDLGAARTYRLTLLGRLSMMANWPVFFLGIAQVALIALLIAWGPPTWAVAVPLAAVLLWGWTRSWRVRVTVGPDVLEIHNPLRTYQLPLDQALRFEPDHTDLTSQALPCISATRGEQRVRIIATAGLRATHRKVLAWQLRHLSQRTGCHTTVPPDWPTPAPRRPRP